MSVQVAADGCLTTSCRPPCDLFSETISITIPFALSLSKGASLREFRIGSQSSRIGVLLARQL